MEGSAKRRWLQLNADPQAPLTDKRAVAVSAVGSHAAHCPFQQTSEPHTVLSTIRSAAEHAFFWAVGSAAQHAVLWTVGSAAPRRLSLAAQGAVVGAG
eukprot:366060-Chlamydomonas_euryale.AAC.5